MRNVETIIEGPALETLRDGLKGDAYVPGDLVLRKALAARTGAESTVSARTAQALAEPWRPHRARALMHLWTAAAYDAR